MVIDEFKSIYGSISSNSLRTAVMTQPELVVALIENEYVSKVVKSLAIEELANTLNPEYIELFIESLNDERCIIRQGAVRAFEVMIYNDIETDRVVQILMDHKDQEDFLNKEINQILKEHNLISKSEW